MITAQELSTYKAEQIYRLWSLDLQDKITEVEQGFRSKISDSAYYHDTLSFKLDGLSEDEVTQIEWYFLHSGYNVKSYSNIKPTTRFSLCYSTGDLKH